MINHIWGNIYIGNDRDTSPANLKRFGITAILDLTELHIDERLDEEAMDQVDYAIMKLSRLLSKGNKVLVHCHAGIDRAPFVVAGYLYAYENQTFTDSYDFVKWKRPQTMQHWDWFSQFNEKGEKDG